MIWSQSAASVRACASLRNPQLPFLTLRHPMTAAALAMAPPTENCRRVNRSFDSALRIANHLRLLRKCQSVFRVTWTLIEKERPPRKGAAFASRCCEVSGWPGRWPENLLSLDGSKADRRRESGCKYWHCLGFRFDSSYGHQQGCPGSERLCRQYPDRSAELSGRCCQAKQRTPCRKASSRLRPRCADDRKPGGLFLPCGWRGSGCALSRPSGRPYRHGCRQTARSHWPDCDPLEL